MLAIGWIGFNIVNERFVSSSNEAAKEAPMTINPVSDYQDGPAVNASSSSSRNDTTISQTGDGAEQQVKAMLKNRADAWNNRNLNRYMEDYRKFDSLRVSFNGQTEKGWDAVRDFFEPKFGPSMGTLRIDNMKVHMVGDYASIVTADWNLEEENKITNGRMNLVMKKVDAAWRITTENLTER